MFRGVKLKLVIINIVIVGIVLLLFFTGIYLLMKRNTVRQTEQLLRSLTTEVRMQELRHATSPQISIPRSWFYVKYSTEGKLIGQSAGMPATGKELNRILNETFLQERDKGLIRLKADTYRFLRSIPADLHNVTFVFLSTQPEREVLGRLGTVLLSVGIAGLVVVLVSSLFLADRALIPIKQAWERQKNFVADASHELRSPLAVMQTNLELVLGNREESVESQSKWLENVQMENRRMTRLVNDLLLLARADSDQQLIERGLFPLHETIKAAVESYEPVASKKNIRLELQQEDEIVFFGDENRIKQLTVIMIDNAIKYTASGGRAAVRLKRRNGCAELTVEDTGLGMDGEHLNKIFERFYRIDTARSRDNGGAGLGLSIAEWIVKEHKGTISVDSTPGKGSTFKALLPLFLQKG